VYLFVSDERVREEIEESRSRGEMYQVARAFRKVFSNNSNIFIHAEQKRFFLVLLGDTHRVHFFAWTDGLNDFFPSVSSIAYANRNHY